MKQYLFIPYEPTQAEILYLRHMTIRDFRKLAGRSSAKCAVLAFDFQEANGLKLLFTCSDGEISDGVGKLLGPLRIGSSA